MNFKLDVLKDESKAQKKEISRLIKSDQDKLYSDSDYKLLKKKAKDMQFKLGVIKKELKERDAIIDELTQQVAELAQNMLAKNINFINMFANLKGGQKVGWIICLSWVFLLKLYLQG